MQPSEWQLRLMAYLDDELAPEDRNAFEEEMAQNEEIHEEMRKLQMVKDMTSRIAFADLEEADWKDYWRGIYNRSEQTVGWVLLSAGATILSVYGLYHFMQELWLDTSIPFVIRAGLFAFLAGIAILLVSVARHRLHVSKNDPYRGVTR